MSNRVGGTNPNDPKGPDSMRSQEHRRIEKVEKVRSVDETENEQRARKKFRSFMDDEESNSKEPRKPSPFETQFHASEEATVSDGMIEPHTSFDDLGDEVVASPPYSPSPDVTIFPEAEENESPPLPRNHNFWQHVDSSADQSKKSPDYREIHHGQTREGKKKAAEKERIEKKKKEELLVAPHVKEKESLYGPPGKKVEKLNHLTEVDKKKKNVTHETPLVPTKEKHEKEVFRHSSKKEKKEEHFLPSIHHDVENAFVEKHHTKEKEGKPSGKFIEIEAPSITTLPAQVVPLAQVATTQAAPYLSNQIAPLFFQMVGTIYVMTTTPGVSKTEILLNAPSFANSKFYGSTISIEKYATAPDSLNIRLTGTNEAVKTFSDNMTNLYAAFQNGNFNFRIGRITAEYSTERPLVRRKESGDKDSERRGR